MIAQQTRALLTDAYRELNAKKLFWITLVLSVLFAASFALLGINERGITIINYTLDVPFFNTNNMSEATFYKLMFTNLGLGIWLTWIAAILALVSTAQIFPDFVSAGSIELALSKPISRTRLFLTKYALGLLFVGLQVAAFCAAAFLAIGLRGGAWEPGLFVAVPLVVLFFSYLFAVCVLVGLITRSTIAALLVTLLFWFLVFVANTADTITLSQSTRHDLNLQLRTDLIQQTEDLLEQRREQLEEAQAAAASEEARPSDRQQIERLERAIEGGERYLVRLDELQAESASAAEAWAPWRVGVYTVKTILPKTQETIALTERWLVDAANLDTSELGPPGTEASGMDENAAAIFGDNASMRESTPPQQVNDAVAEKYRQRTIPWILGTSIAFEAFILLIATLYFKRKDF